MTPLDGGVHSIAPFRPGLKLLASPGTGDLGTPVPLAGKSTLNRLEQSWETGNRRYHQMVPNLKKLSNLFVTLFLDAHQTPPARITLDIDATDVETHGRQENAFFHGYYPSDLPVLLQANIAQPSARDPVVGMMKRHSRPRSSAWPASMADMAIGGSLPCSGPKVGT